METRFKVKSKYVPKWISSQNKKTEEAFARSSIYREIKQDMSSLPYSKELYRFSTISFDGEYLHWEEDSIKKVALPATTPRWRIEREQKQIQQPTKILETQYSPNNKRALVKFFDMEKKLFSQREFDFSTDEYVPAEKKPFRFEQSKKDIYISWRDNNSVWLIDNFSKVIKIWKRSTSLDKAKIIFRGKPSDHISLVSYSIDTNQKYTLIYQYTPDHCEHVFLIKKDLLIKLALPAHIFISDYLDNYIICELYQDWKKDKNHQYLAGSILTVNLDTVKTDSVEVSLIFQPTAMVFAYGSPQVMTDKSILLVVLDNVYSQIYRFRLSGEKWVSSGITMPFIGRIKKISEVNNSILFWSESFLQPSTLFLLTKDQESPKALLSNPDWFDSRDMLVKQNFVKSTDGVLVPYFIVQHKSIKNDGSNPTLLHAYGGFGQCMLPLYYPFIGKLWLEKKGIYVLANIRGGAEFGPNWHQTVIQKNRHQVLEDFIAVAKDLITKKITSNNHLGIYGGSGGGLLVALAFIKCPELFNAVVCQSALLDMLNFHKYISNSKTRKYWMSEFGNPGDPDIYPAIKKQSPIHNLSKDHKYPEILFLASTNDDIVTPVHSRKMVLKMQNLGFNVYYYEGNHEHTTLNRLRPTDIKELTSNKNFNIAFSYLQSKLMVKKKDQPLFSLKTSASFFSKGIKRKFEESESQKPVKRARLSVS